MKYIIQQKDIDNRLAFLRPGAKAGDVEDLPPTDLQQYGVLEEAERQAKEEANKK